nr:unnamed protein product [Spirometra erinaceieuropaei]
MEEEKDGEIPFLDVQVSRQEDGALQTGVFRKATDTAKILHYSSNQPLSHKRSCVRTLFLRINTHCSTEAEKLRERKSLWRLFLSNGRAETHFSDLDDRRSELRYLQRLFMANGYPRNFIERGRQAGPSRRLVTERPTIWRALPYIDGVSEAVSRLLRLLGIGIVHRPESTIRHLVMRPKAPLPLGETTDVIYRIRCNSCEANYIGETGKRLQTRVEEHMRPKEDPIFR